MASAQGDRQAGVRGFTLTALNYEGDWSALFDMAGIPFAGGFNGRLLAWINFALGTSYTELNGAMAAYAAMTGSTNWSSVGALPQGGTYPPNLAPSGFRWGFVFNERGEAAYDINQPAIDLVRPT